MYFFFFFLIFKIHKAGLNSVAGRFQPPGRMFDTPYCKQYDLFDLYWTHWFVGQLMGFRGKRCLIKYEDLEVAAPSLNCISEIRTYAKIEQWHGGEDFPTSLLAGEQRWPVFLTAVSYHFIKLYSSLCYKQGSNCVVFLSSSWPHSVWCGLMHWEPVWMDAWDWASAKYVGDLVSRLLL